MPSLLHSLLLASLARAFILARTSYPIIVWSDISISPAAPIWHLEGVLACFYRQLLYAFTSAWAVVHT